MLEFNVFWRTKILRKKESTKERKKTGKSLLKRFPNPVERAPSVAAIAAAVAGNGEL